MRLDSCEQNVRLPCRVSRTWLCSITLASELHGPCATLPVAGRPKRGTCEGRPHEARAQAEHGDGAVIASEIHAADQGDTSTLRPSLKIACENLAQLASDKAAEKTAASATGRAARWVGRCRTDECEPSDACVFMVRACTMIATGPVM